MSHVRFSRIAIVCLLYLIITNNVWARGGTASGSRGVGEERIGGGFRGGAHGRGGNLPGGSGQPQTGPKPELPGSQPGATGGPPRRPGPDRSTPPPASVGIHGNQPGPQRPPLGSNPLGENLRREGMPRNQPRQGSEIHNGMPGREMHRETVHSGPPQPGGPHNEGRPLEGPYGARGPYRPEMMHSPGSHWQGYHQAYFDNHPVHLARPGYYPSYYYHPWYHGPWAGHPWGWGWGYGPGVTFGLAGSGWGVAVNNGWGYPVSYGPYGPYGYWGRPLGWGFGGWGLGTTVYTSGYYVYENPYYSSVVYPAVVYDYSRPIPVVARPVQSPSAFGVAATSEPALPLDNRAFASARDAFRRGDYPRAMSDIDSAIKSSPSDAVMHEFRSLVLFALRDYRQSAAVAHSVLAVGPGWDYTTMSSLYPDPFTYSDQLRQLEEYSRRNPRAAEAHFLLAYHDMINSRKEAAQVELQQVVSLMPNDRLAAELLNMVKGPPKTATTAQTRQNPSPNLSPRTYDGTTTLLSNTPYEPRSSGVITAASAAPAATSPVPATPDTVDQKLLPGTWNATRSDGSKFSLVLTEEGQFNWTYSTPNHSDEELTGSYTVEGPVLILERGEGGALAGVARFSGQTQMNFKLVGAPTEDQGLDFEKG